MLDKVFLFLSRWSYSPLFLTLLFVVLIKAPLTESLWVDEAISAWIISGDPFIRAIETQGQSPLYFLLLKTIVTLIGNSELSLRILSILCYLTSALLFWKLAAKLIGVAGASIATSALVTSDSVIIAAISVRPYALALLFALVTITFFHKWIDSGKWIWCFLYQVFLSLTFYAHYLFVAVAFVLPFVAIEKKAVSWKKIIFSGVVPLLFCTFGVPHLALLYEKKEILSFVTAPSFKEVFFTVFEPALVISFVMALIFGFITEPKLKILKPKLSLILLGIVWGIIPAVIFYFGKDGSLFIPRYFLWTKAGSALLFGTLLSSFKSEKTLNVAALVFTLFLFSHEIQRTYVIEDWKSASMVVNEKESKGPIFVYSGLVEGSEVSLIQTKEEYEYLTSPLHYYSVNKDTLLMPLPLSIDEKEYFTRLILPSIEKYGSVLGVIAFKTLPDNAIKDSYTHFEVEFNKRGIEMKSEKDLSLVRVVVLSKGKE